MKLSTLFDRFRTRPEDPKAVEANQGFVRRAPRFFLEAPISFVVDQHEYQGTCINVSESGLLANFPEPPEIWTNGVITLEAGEYFLSIQASVARLMGKDVAFAFFVRTENDSMAVRILVESVVDFPLPEPKGVE